MLNCLLYSNTWNNLTVKKLSSGSFKNVINKMCSQIIHREFQNHHQHHHHVVPLAWISLTLSRHFSLSFIASSRSAGLHSVSSYSCCMYVLAGRPAFSRPYVGVHSSTSLMSPSLLLQQCPASLTHLTWIVLWWEAGGRIVGALWGVAAMTNSILRAKFFCNWRLASSPAVLLASKWYIHTAVSTRPLPGRNRVSFYRSGLISIWLIAYDQLYDYSYCIKSFLIWVLKSCHITSKSSNQMTGAEIDWLHLNFSSSFRQNLSSHPHCQDILLSVSCQIWDFLPSCWGCLLAERHKICVPDDKFGFSRDNC